MELDKVINCSSSIWLKTIEFLNTGNPLYRRSSTYTAYWYYAYIFILVNQMDSKNFVWQ